MRGLESISGLYIKIKKKKDLLLAKLLPNERSNQPSLLRYNLFISENILAFYNDDVIYVENIFIGRNKYNDVIYAENGNDKYHTTTGSTV